MPQRFVVFFVFFVAYFLSYFLRSTNAVIAEDLVRDLSLTASQLGFMTSLFFAGLALTQLPFGAALDRFGARFVTPLLMLASVAGCLLFGFGESFAVLALGRALIGVGTAGNLMGALKSFSGWFGGERFALVSSTYLALGSTGALVAATPLALLSARFGWRSVFLFGAAATFLSILALTVWAKDAPVVQKLATQQGGFQDIFRDVRFWRIAFLNFAMVGSLFAYQSLWAGPFLTEVLGLASVSVGNFLFLMSGGITLGYVAAGFLGSRFSVAKVIATSAGVFASVLGGLALFEASWPQWSLVALFGAFGVSAAFAVLMFTQVRSIFPLHLTGRAVTAVNLFGLGGSALLQWGLGVLIGSFAQQNGVYPPQAYSAAFALSFVLCVLALLFYLPLLKRAAKK